MDYKFTENDHNYLDELAKMTSNYVSPLAIGPDTTKIDLIKTIGTASFIDTGLQKIMITNNHMIEAFYDFKKERDDAKFRCESLIFEPGERLIDRNKYYDLAVFNISDSELEAMRKQSCTCFYWPPKRVFAGEPVVFSSCPGKQRRFMNNEVNFINHPFLEKVHNSTEDNFSIAFEREIWVKGKTGVDIETPIDLGGFSGTAVFRVITNTLIHYLEPVGIFYESSENLDIQFIRHIDFINKDGTIKKRMLK